MCSQKTIEEPIVTSDDNSSNDETGANAQPATMEEAMATINKLRAKVRAAKQHTASVVQLINPPRPEPEQPEDADEPRRKVASNPNCVSTAELREVIVRCSVCD